MFCGLAQRNLRFLVLLTTNLLLVIGVQCFATSENLPAAPYFFESQAGGQSEIVFPEFISAENKAHSTLSFSPDGKQAVWCAFYHGEKGPDVFDQRIFHSQLKDGVWTAPQQPTFSVGYTGGGPVFTPDGQHIVFTSKRPATDDEKAPPARLWKSSRQGDSWGTPQMMGSPADTLRHTNLVSISRSGNIYFGDRIPPFMPGIFTKQKTANGYSDAQALSGQVNSQRQEFDGWIDPEERFLLLTAMGGPDRVGGGDLYISIRQADGSWGPKLSLGDQVNTKEFERFASLTPDFKTLFFVRATGSNFPSEEHSYYRIDAESVLTGLGYRLIHSCDSETAVSVLKLVTELYPDSWNAWDSLADSYKYVGDRQQSIRCYEKAIEINPDNPSSEWGIRLMERAMLDIAGSTDAILIHKPGQQTDLLGPYLGQSLPGSKPEIFAPGIASVCGRVEYNPTFTPDGKEMYFSTSAGLMVAYLNDQGWTAPKPAEFGGFEPLITRDGKHMFIGRGSQIWMLDRAGDTWENERFVCPGMRPYVDDAGNLYVTDISREDHVGMLQILRPDGAGFTEPENLPDLVNMPQGAAHPCISPDGNTLIFDSFRTDEAHPNEFGDFFITQRKSDGSWAKPRRLPPTINTPGENICGTYSPDGKLFFYTANHDIWWVSTEALDF